MEAARLKLYRGTWCAVWRDGAQTRRASLHTKDRHEAERRLTDWKAAQQRAGRAFVAEIVEAYLADRADSAARATIEFSWKPLRPVFGHLRPDQVDRARCRAYAERRRKQKRSEGTIARELGVLRAALRWHDRATPAVVELPPSPPPREYHLTREEWQRFRDGLRSAHLRLFAIIAYGTAARSSAVLQLTWDQVDFEAGFINFGRGETRYKGRANVPMNPTVRGALEAAREIAVSDYVVEWAGDRIASVRKSFTRAAESLGFPKLTPHVLRHSAAVHLAEAGMPMSEISQYLGHASTAVTERVYARYSPTFLRKLAAVLV
ncbi:MAG TPA: site-specific integrase [Stellaceae bacterium]|nr:site-specific integrase [Stellaceae bacterium]